MEAGQIPLRDLHLPPPVSWWPPAPGWWLLAIVMLVAALLLARAWRNRRRWRSDATPELSPDDVWQHWRAMLAASATTDGHRLARDISEFMRRVALSLRPRREVAALTGEEWLEFLDGALGDRSFRDGVGRVLITAPYQRAAPDDLRECVPLCERWLQAMLRQIPVAC